MKEWMDLRVSGFLGFLHKIVMFITWPFRHWKYLLALLIIALLAAVIVPLFYGVKIADIPAWYKAKMTHPVLTVIKNNIQNIKQNAENKISQSVDELKEKAQKIAPEVVSVSKSEPQENKEKIRFTAWNVAKFNKAEYKPQPSPAKQSVKLKAPTFAELKEEASAQKEQSIEKPATSDLAQTASDEPYYEGNLADYYTVRRDLDLIYLNESEKLYGKVDVVGPNSLYINNTYVYLYGIYTNPNTYDEQAAQLYLEKLIDGQPVHCDVVAYSIQAQIPTALCFLNGKLLNRELVEAEYASDVALK